MENKVIVIRDYAGYFERTAQNIADALPQVGLTIEVEAGPYRCYDVNYEWENDTTIHLDFYSAVRSGFGSTHTAELIKEFKDYLAKRNIQ